MAIDHHITTHGRPHEPAANIVPFVLPDEEIEIVTGIYLVDIDPKVVARRLRHRHWSDRGRFFCNIIADSAVVVTKMVDYVAAEDDAPAFLDWAIIEMMRRIGETLDLWGDPEPADTTAAALYLLSLKQEHRRAGLCWIEKRGYKHPLDFFKEVDPRLGPLALFFRMTYAGDVLARTAWRAGRTDCPVVFNVPDDPAPKKTGGKKRARKSKAA